MLGLGAGPKPKPSSGVAARRCAQVEAATRRAQEAEAQSAKLAEELTTVKNELAEMCSNFNQQLLDIQAQLRESSNTESVDTALDGPTGTSKEIDGIVVELSLENNTGYESSDIRYVEFESNCMLYPTLLSAASN
ncbi:hypothetical protein Q3G72_004962 [Acer saccharum]|nr:hypothetical protein Q3G72_004962 [Acer saccharum]